MTRCYFGSRMRGRNRSYGRILQKAQATRKENLEAIKKRIQHQQETARELQGALKEIIHNEQTAVAEKLEAVKLIMELETRCF